MSRGLSDHLGNVLNMIDDKQFGLALYEVQAEARSESSRERLSIWQLCAHGAYGS